MNPIVGILRALLTLNATQFQANLATAQTQLVTFTKTTKAMGQQMSQLGTTMTRTLTLPILGFGGAAAKAAIDFQSSFTGIKKTVTATREEFAKLEKGMKDLSTKIPVNVNELNKIGQLGGQLGIHTKNLIDFTKVIAQLGVATNLTTEEAATGLARIANITGMPQEKFANLGGSIVQMGNNFATTEKEIVAFSLRIAGAGRIAGLTVPAIVGISAALASVGVTAEAGGTATQKVLLSMTTAVIQGGKKLELFGKTAFGPVEDAGKRFKELFDKDAKEAFTRFVEGLGEQGKGAIKTLDQLDLRDQRLIRSFLALAGAGDKTRDAIKQSTTEFEKNIEVNALAREANQRFGTMQSDLIMLWNQLRVVMITFGEALMPTIKMMIDGFRQLIPVLQEAAQWFKELPKWVQATAIAFGLLVAALGPTIYIFGQLLLTVSGVAGLFTKTGAGALTLAGIFKGIGSYLPTFTKYFVALATTVRAAVASFVPLSGAASALGMALTALGWTVAIVATAFLAWKFGTWLGEVTGLTDWVGKLIARFGELLGILPKGTAANYDQARSAAKAAEETKKQALSVKELQDAEGDRLEALLLGVEAERTQAALLERVAKLQAAGKLTPDVMQRVAEQAELLASAGQKLDPILERIVKFYGSAGPLGKNAKAAALDFSETALEELARVKEEIAGLDAAERKELETGLELGRKNDVIADSLGISAEAVAYYAKKMSELKSETNKVTKAFEEFTGVNERATATLLAQAVENQPGTKGYDPKKVTLFLDKMTEDQQRDAAEQLKKGIDSWQQYGDAVPDVVSRVFSAVMNLRLIPDMLAENAKAITGVIPDAVKAMGADMLDIAAAADERRGKAAILAVESRQEVEAINEEMLIRRVEHEKAAAEASGKGWQVLAELDRKLAWMRYQEARRVENLRFAEATRGLHKLSAEYAALATVHEAAMSKIDENYRMSESERETALKRAHNDWLKLWADVKDFGKQTFDAISDGLMEVLVTAKTFKEVFTGIWDSIRQSVAQILSQMLQDFLKYLARLAAAQLAARFATGGGGGIGGGGGGGVGGAIADTAAGQATKFGLAKLLGLGGTAATSTGTVLAAGVPGVGLGSIYAGGTAATTVPGVGLGSLLTGGGTAAAGGAGGTAAGTAGTAGGSSWLMNPALWTNPYTIAAVAAAAIIIWGVTKKGWFRGGEEGVVVNPRRDKFLAQFGDPSNKGVGGAAHNLATRLTAMGAGPGGGNYMANLQGSHSKKAFEQSEDRIIDFFAQHGVRGVKKFNFGGFVPPHSVVPAILHGGSMGEMVMPMSAHGGSGLFQGMRGGMKTVNFNIQAWDGDDVSRVFRRDIIPRLKQSLQLNQDDLLGHTKRVIGGTITSTGGKG